MRNGSGAGPRGSTPLDTEAAKPRVTDDSTAAAAEWISADALPPAWIVIRFSDESLARSLGFAVHPVVAWHRHGGSLHPIRVGANPRVLRCYGCQAPAGAVYELTLDPSTPTAVSGLFAFAMGDQSLDHDKHFADAWPRDWSEITKNEWRRHGSGVDAL
jgi:hypothetical protein